MNTDLSNLDILDGLGSTHRYRAIVEIEPPRPVAHRRAYRLPPIAVWLLAALITVPVLSMMAVISALLIVDLVTW